MEIGWTDVGSGGYILVSNTLFVTVFILYGRFGYTIIKRERKRISNGKKMNKNIITVYMNQEVLAYDKHILNISHVGVKTFI